MEQEEPPAKACSELTEFLTAQLSIITKHLGRHKYFNHISDEDQAIIDFAKKYGWIMRETFCGFGCKKKDECEYSKQLRNGQIDKNEYNL